MTRNRAAISKRRLPPRLRPAFARDEGGAIAVLFALLLVPMLAICGGALDVATAQRLKAKLQATAEQAAQAAVAQLSEPERAAEWVLKHACEAQGCGLGAESFVTIRLDEDVPQVRVRIEAEVATNFLGLIGRDTFDVSGEALVFVPVESRPLARALQSPSSRRTLRAIQSGKDVTPQQIDRLMRSAGLPDG
ncbi:MAG: TadE/TadG family type IV pilus assembly protein [Pseudomonadota bacterium]